MNISHIPITHSTVKVMRSHDYCHFEVSLGYGGLATIEEIDALRKEAARLADKAVAQYKTAKRAAELQSNIADKWRLGIALKTPENERLPGHKAVIKYHQDAAFRAQFDYDYQDDWTEPYSDEDEAA